jgi:hypothetical protein
VSHVAVLKAIRTGRIRQNGDGLIDSQQADRDWAANTHPVPKAPRAVPVAMTDDFGFARARTLRAHYEALHAKLDYERRSAGLLSAAEVKLATVQVTQAFKAAMLEIPAKIAAQLAGETDPVRVCSLLATAIREALAAFAGRCEAGGRTALAPPAQLRAPQRQNTVAPGCTTFVARLWGKAISKIASNISG